MQAVDLNLASRPFKNDTLLWVGLIVAVSGLGLLSWHNVESWQEHRELVAGFQESRTHLRDRLDDLDRRDRETLRDIDGYDLQALSLKSAKANEVIRWKSFSWTRLFNQLQQVLPHDVQMSSVHPVFRGDQRRSADSVEDLEQVPVSVEGAARTLEGFMSFERNLIADGHFSRLEPANWATDDNSNETIFRIRFLYDPRVSSAGAADRAPLAEARPGAGAAAPERPGSDRGPAGIAAVAAPTGTKPGGVEAAGALAAEGLARIERRAARKKLAGAPGPPAVVAENDAGLAAERSAPVPVETELRTPPPPWGVPPGTRVESLDAPDEGGDD